jgi:hypothetical protein
VQHRQEAEVAAAEECERAAAETAAMAARAARLAMAKLAATRAEVEAAAAVDAARAAAAELKSLRASSTNSSVSADDDRDNELKLAREATPEQAAQWAAAHPQGRRGGSLNGRGRTGGRVPDGGSSPDRSGRVDVGLTEIAAFTGSVALPPRTGAMVTMGSRPLLGTSVPAADGQPSSRPTTSSESR